ncbi:methylated-DNA--[protein]-cysteine S-methyltransferase [Eubacterium sp. 1001713B170207_170306_E7]|uniref:MGMT family protein n=1 Tax=Eubacterium sp. 1001713B170207_170306_E7 TaxID=2787097 RepID=UPI00189ADB80|nr:methylated-DNA--[protein]-cysteine S-methyltransferase [Eubacterium sp. 1001713B170207_170306_E7]
MPASLNENFYSVIAEIPEGRVASYGQIALLAGRPRAARAVGAALRRVPEHLELPCHRVVFSDGSLCEGLIFGGPGVQKQLLKKEGVAFLPNGKVNMRRCLWNGPGDLSR